eukprot:gnl/TRDRNA2_/TRDRNA2_143519_c0_seq1.p1 gnl/TRDRNA2_/TRDRNA2_143519_c0~~gnl/TRDRNA2_/TRDRNA2_143519_c0_seq1.p1  ORF type:complete len:284 (+),score=40.71 gnl/TRDRNA2_/TRDRNA2_143519_c0_seq1:135-986(+)
MALVIVALSLVEAASRTHDSNSSAIATVDRLDDKMFDRALLAASSSDRSWDSLMLGKPGQIALPTSHLASCCTVRCPPFSAFNNRCPFLLHLRSQPARAVLVHGMEKEAAQPWHQDDKTHNSPLTDARDVTGSPLEWTSAMMVAANAVAREESLSVHEVQEKFTRLSQLLGLEDANIQYMNLKGVMQLALNAAADVTLRMMQLKSIMPNADLLTLVARCPRLLEERTSIADVKADVDARVDTAHASTSGMHRDQLKEMMLGSFYETWNEYCLRNSLWRPAGSA